MFNMSDLSIELQLTEKKYTFLFKDTPLGSVALNPLNILPRQTKLSRKVNVFIGSFKLKDFFPIN